MKVVSENSEADIARARALAEIQWTMRTLAANILRITRGAGKSAELGRQLVDLVDGLLAYRAAAGEFPGGDEIAAPLQIDLDPSILSNISQDEAERYEAEQQVIRGALQISASRLLQQLTQERSGDREMYAGITAIEESGKRRRKEYLASVRAAAGKTPKKPTRRRRVVAKVKKSVD